MTIRCWEINSREYPSGQSGQFVCGNLIEWRCNSGPGNNKCALIIDGVNTGRFFDYTLTNEVSPSYCTNCGPPIPLTNNQPYDCLNGNCLPSVTYSTPGVFFNLAACQSGCAKNSTCTGECVSSDDLAALQQAAENVKNRICGGN